MSDEGRSGRGGRGGQTGKRPSAKQPGGQSPRRKFAGKPGSRPDGKPGGKPGGRPGGKPGSKPGGRPGSRPANRPARHKFDKKAGNRPGAPGRRSSIAPAPSIASRPGRVRSGRFVPGIDTVEPIYQRTGVYFAQIAGGLEKLGARELEALGATDINIINRGLDFKADQETLYRICYCSRLITRVLAPMHKFRAENAEALYLETKRIDWTNIFRLDQTFAVFANVSYSKIDHSQFAALKVKDSVVDMFRKRYKQKRPNVNPSDPDLWLALHIHNDEATLSIDCSGGSLHKRGYRQQQVEAPIQETLAAAILEISGWNGKTKLYDPMCGSGTLLSEAWMRAANLPAQVLRKKFGFMMLPDY
ncbi:hypothetical protein CSA17_06460, partial [bacterium DOLJORAL78_65_58]